MGMRIAADPHFRVLYTIFLNIMNNNSLSVITTVFETKDLLLIKIGCKGRHNLRKKQINLK